MFVAVSAGADPLLSGTSTATFSEDLTLGEWKYCIEVTWDSGQPPRGLSHLDLILTLSQCCRCEDLPFSAHNPAGVSSGEPREGPVFDVEQEDIGPDGSEDGSSSAAFAIDITFSLSEDECLVYYTAELSCDGDAAIPGLNVPLIKFEPIEDGCTPGPTGTGVFCFYSNWPPAPIVSGDALLAVKAGQNRYFGNLSGVLPGCALPSATERVSWSMVRHMFR